MMGSPDAGGGPAYCSRGSINHASMIGEPTGTPVASPTTSAIACSDRAETSPSIASFAIVATEAMTSPAASVNGVPTPSVQAPPPNTCSPFTTPQLTSRTMYQGADTPVMT